MLRLHLSRPKGSAPNGLADTLEGSGNSSSCRQGSRLFGCLAICDPFGCQCNAALLLGMDHHAGCACSTGD